MVGFQSPGHPLHTPLTDCVCVSYTVLVPNSNEDSVDIYDDMDVHPGSSAGNLPASELDDLEFPLRPWKAVRVSPWFHTVKSSPATAQLRESMDLYEELVTEEQHSRESSYTEVSAPPSCLHHREPRVHKAEWLFGQHCQKWTFFSVGVFQLTSRFQAAQNQIQELRQRLEQMELLVCLQLFSQQ